MKKMLEKILAIYLDGGASNNCTCSICVNERALAVEVKAAINTFDVAEIADLQIMRDKLINSKRDPYAQASSIAAETDRQVNVLNKVLQAIS